MAQSTSLGVLRGRRVSAFVLLGFALLAVSALGSGWVLKNPSGPASATTPPPATDRVTYSIGHVDVDGGVTYPLPTTPGTVDEVFVEEGATVKAGAPLFRMNDVLAKADVQRAEEGVRAAKSQVREAKNAVKQLDAKKAAQSAVLEVARQDVELARLAVILKTRLSGISGFGVHDEDVQIAKAQQRKADLGVEAEQRKLEALTLEASNLEEKALQAESAVAEREALLSKARHVQSEATVRARTDGLILRRILHPGDLITAETKVPPLVLCPARPRIVRVEVPQEFAARLTPGLFATIQDDTTSGQGTSWTGKVARVADWMAHRRSILPDPGQFYDIRTLECLVEFDPGQTLPHIGQRVRVELKTVR